jgi:glycosyltransferase involved in cell wall biosynthesis
VDQLSFALVSLLGGLVTGPCDVLIVDSPPLILGLPGYLLSRTKRTRFVFNVADLWPESAVALGVIRNRMAIAVAKRTESFIYRKAHLITAVTRTIRSELIRRGLPETKVAHVPNGVDTELFQPGPSDEEVRRSWNADKRHVVLYAGNIGLAQGLGTVLDAAKLLCEESDVHFVLVGEGGDKQRLLDRARLENIRNVVFMPSRPHSNMPAIINSADAVVVLLRAHKLFEGALPSKIYEAMACEKPLLLGAKGEAARMINDAEAGTVVEPEQAQSLADAVLKLKQQQERALEMGKSGRRFAVKHMGRTAIVERLNRLLLDLLYSPRTN